MLNGYVLAKVSLVRPACPKEISARAENTMPDWPIVLKRNTNEYGKVEATQYCPAVVVAAGAARRARLLEQGIVYAWAWVENGALEINADDAMGANELITRLNDLLNTKYGGTLNVPGQYWAYIIEAFPFEGYCIYGLKGKKYRQAFALDPVERKVALNGPSIEVAEKFVDACGDQAMARVETGVRYAYAPPRGAPTTVTTGAKNSELVTQIVRNWTNIMQAVNDYLDAVKKGAYKPMKPAFAPVPLTDNGKLTAMLASKRVALIDFVRWSAQMQEQGKAAAFAGKKEPGAVSIRERTSDRA